MAMALKYLFRSQASLPNRYFTTDEEASTAWKVSGYRCRMYAATLPVGQKERKNTP